MEEEKMHGFSVSGPVAVCMCVKESTKCVCVCVYVCVCVCVCVDLDEPVEEDYSDGPVPDGECGAVQGSQ